MTMTPAAMRDSRGEELEEVWIGLLSISHPLLAEPLRVTTDAVETVADGAVWHPYPLELVAPSDRADEVQRAQIRIANVDRRILRAVREIQGQPAVVEIRMVLSSDPDTVQARHVLQLQQVRADAVWVTADLGEDPVLDRAWPKDSFDPSLYPGLFA